MPHQHRRVPAATLRTAAELLLEPSSAHRKAVASLLREIANTRGKIEVEFAQGAGVPIAVARDAFLLAGLSFA
jgi:hypothetical protein